MLAVRRSVHRLPNCGAAARLLSTNPLPEEPAPGGLNTAELRKLKTAEAAATRPKTSRPGARVDEMEEAASKIEGGKTRWQKFCGGMVNLLRPAFAKAAPVMMPILDYRYKRMVQDAANIFDLQDIAEKRAHAMVYGYLAGGADAERCLRRSVSAYNDVELRHAVLHGVGTADMDLRTTILGQESQMPYFITSCAGQRMFHADGEVATAKAAKKHGLHMALSQLTTSTFEEVRAAHPDGAKTLQLYVWRDRVLLKEVLDRAKECGFTGLALTADFSWVGNRERETRTGFTVPPSYSPRQCIDAIKSPAWTYDFMSRVPYGYKAVPDADFPAESLVDFIAAQMKPEFDWKDAEWLCSEWGDQGPVALKGVARGTDAARAIQTGFKSIWVSNHGGRQLEDSVATFDVLPEVRAAVGDDVEVILDGGVRRGLDIVKALARGADAVAIGRAYLFGLAAGGEAGVDKALTLLTRDVYLAMGLLGCRTVAELKANAQDILLVNAMSARRQGGIFDRRKAGEVLQPCLQ